MGGPGDAASGTELWVRRANGPANSEDGAYSETVSPDGSTLFVTGFSYVSFKHDVDSATVAYATADGTPAWAKAYNGPGSYDDVAQSIVVSPDGSAVFVTGGSYGGVTTGDDYATVAYDAGPERPGG